MTGQPVRELGRALAAGLVVDEAADTVVWAGPQGSVTTGLHDYAAMYAVPGLYEAVYVEALQGGSARLLAQALAQAVPAGERAQQRVLDVGAGTGMVGEELADVGFQQVAGTDIEPASAVALVRDRPEVYSAVRTLDLTHRTDEDDAWLTGLAPTIVTLAGALGYGHLPVEALAVLTGLLRPGALLALTAAHDLATAPELAPYAELLLGPVYEQVARVDGMHRRTADGRQLEVTALVLRRAAG